jgi:glycerol-3-phosphate O-acyltransferase
VLEHLTDDRRDGATEEAASRPVLVLSGAQTTVERELVDRWVADTYTDGSSVEVMTVADERLAERLGRRDDPLVAPVRVGWLPRERHGTRRARWSDLLLLANPRRPRPQTQQRIVRREPDRVRVVAGEPAGLEELRGRWAVEAGRVGGAQGFAAWVGRQAMLALERAERAVVGDRYKVPRLVAEQILDSARFRAEVATLAERLELPEEEVLARAAAGLQETVAVQSRLAIDLFAATMRPLHARAWKVDVDLAGLEPLRELGRRYALVFLPSHRSYTDPLILATILHERGFPRNHVMGGNNMSFWPIGPLARRAGLVFIPRSFRDDEVYKLVMREYIAYLVAKRFNLEWYIEGGRSRTGKLRPPRYGLLRYLIDAVRSGAAEDVYLVPVSISYDQLSETKAMAAEERGATKQKEGLGWLAGYARSQRRLLGAVHVRFGEPLGLRERVIDADRAEPPHAMEKVAFEICDGINRATPVLATSLVTLALLDGRDRALTLSEVRAAVEPLLAYARRRDLPGCELDALWRAWGVRRTLEALRDAGVVTVLAEGTEPVYAIEPGQHLVAAFSRNSAIHWFIARAIVELAMLHVAESDSTDPTSTGLTEARRLRDLLKFEFFFAERQAFRDQLITELELIDPRWEERVGTPEECRQLLAHSRPLFAHRVLRGFLESYLVVAERLAARDPRAPLERSAFLAECVGVGRQWLAQRRLQSPESVSRELFGNALALAARRDLIDPGRDELQAARQAFADEVRSAVERIGAIAALDEAGDNGAV